MDKMPDSKIEELANMDDLLEQSDKFSEKMSELRDVDGESYIKLAKEWDDLQNKISEILKKKK